MKVKRVKKRGYLFQFDDLLKDFGCITNVYVVVGKKHVFICDTYLGKEPMEKIINYLNEIIKGKEVIVFNSHSDWDHIWGNCYFTEKILSHELCLDNIIKKGNYELKKYSPLASGKVSIKLPNITFKERLTFQDEEVCFFYSPGHTKDSASLYDISDNVLFVGDNIEYPIPLIYYNNLKKYKKTLEKYALLKPDIFVLSHGNPDKGKLMESNLEYVKDLINDKIEKYEEGIYKDIHKNNLDVLKNKSGS